MANAILSQAVRAKATDIHIEPREQFVDVRYRVDGVLRSVMKVPNKFRLGLAARLKILTELDIAEARKPQDGRARILLDGRKINLRISVIPTFYGEKVALRLLDVQEARIELANLNFKDSELSLFMESISRPQGIILVTGPTSSGKTTTLYAALSFLRKSEAKNIVTIEDPVEYVIEGVNQMQVNYAKDITFANGLRSILRQDPNVILVGEIRDRDTAEIAFRSALTGHLVLSTLHTNSSVAAITRLLDIGLEPYLIASPIILIVAQRLARLICLSCKEEYEPSSLHIYKLKNYIDKFKIKKFYRGKGCRDCDSTGYSGRTAIFEMFKINEQIRHLIANGASEAVIYNEAIKNGLVPLIEAGIEKVAEGLTTLEEVSRIADIVDSRQIIEDSPDTIDKLTPKEEEKIFF